MRCHSGVFNVELHIRGFSSPGSRDVERLIRSVGVTQIWNRLGQAKGSQILRGRLDSLVQLRHEIAHGSGATSTPADVHQYVDDMRGLAQFMDGIVGDYLRDSCGADEPWETYERGPAFYTPRGVEGIGWQPFRYIR